MFNSVVIATNYYVNVNNFGASPPYTNWATAATKIQDAVDVASANDTVIVTNGIYSVGGAATPGKSLYNRVVIMEKITVRSVNGPDSTIILGQGPNGAGAVRCVFLLKDAMLIGFTLSNGHTRTTDDTIYDQSGGGLLTDGSGAVSNCVIRNCQADYYGGGAILKGGGAVIDSIVLRNSSEWSGGGVCCYTGGEIVQSTIIGNVATNNGGGVYFDTRGSIKKCVVSYNTARDGGGAYCNGLGTIDNSLFVKNKSRQDGGGIFLNNKVRVRNSTVCDNFAERDAGGVYCRLNGTNLNTLIYFNTAGRYGNNHREFGSSPYFSCCCTTPAVSNLDDGGGNITDDPQVYDQVAGDYGLSSASPCIGVGNNLYAPDDYDIDGRQRILGSPQIVDIGCFEHVPQQTGVPSDRYVSVNGGNFWPYDTVQKAAVNIQDAIDTAVNSDRIVVDDGIYKRAYRGVEGMKNRIAVVNKSLKILANTTKPSGMIVLGAKDLLTDGMGTNAVRCAYLKNYSGVLLSGFVLSNGFTRGNNGPTSIDMYQGFGGAVFLDGNGDISNCIIASSVASGGGGVYFNGGGSVINSQITNNFASEAGGGAVINTGGIISNSLICGNSSDDMGGAVFMMNNPTLQFKGKDMVNGALASFPGGLLDSCEILKNQADGSGGAVYMLQSGYVRNCKIVGNWSSVRGGAFFLESGGKVENCKIGINSVTGDGGGAYFASGGEIINSLFYENFGIYGGGAWFDSGGTIQSSTLASNYCVHGGGGIYCSGGGSNINNIIYANRIIGEGGTNYQHNGTGMYYEYCCTFPELTGAADGAGNITNAPDFSDTLAYDFHLLAGSPCLDAGTNLTWMAGAKDLDGNDRIYDGTVDMGCYEDVPEPSVFYAITGYFLLVIGILRKCGYKN